MRKLKVDLVTSLDEKFLDEWQELWNVAWNSHVFNSPQWFCVIKDALEIENYLIFTCYKEEKLFAVFPLVYSKKFGVQVLTNPGTKYSDKSPFLIYDKDKSVLKAFLSKINNSGNIYYSEINDFLLDSLKNIKTSILIDSSEFCPFIPSDPDLLSYISKTQRKKIRSINRNYLDLLRYETFTNDIKKISEIVFGIERESARRLAGKGTFTDSNAEKLFKETLKHYSDKISLDVVFFKGKAIAYWFGITEENIYYAINTAYLDEYSHLVPGKISLNFLLQRLEAQGVELFDFLRGINQLKIDFTPFFTPQYDAYYSSNHLIILWWKLAFSLTNFIMNNHIIYKIFLDFKKDLIYLRNKPLYLFFSKRYKLKSR